MKTNSISILHDSAKVLLSSNPFPHAIIKDALPTSLANQLTMEFPIENFDTSANNKRIDIPASKIQKNKKISSAWKEFIDYHSSSKFFYDVLRVFKPCLLDHEYKSYLKFSSGIRGIDCHKEKQILLDAQISINTPVINASSVRKAHVDNTNKLFSGMYYLPGLNDDSIGGDLELLSWNTSYSDKQKIRSYKEGVSQKHFSRNKTIKYANNVAILFLNSIDALHQVSPRNPTIHPRCFVNLLGELNHDHFKKHDIFQKNINAFKEKARNLHNNLFRS